MEGLEELREQARRTELDQDRERATESLRDAGDVTGWSFVAYGTPGPQGSKTRTKFGMRESSTKVAPWREAVKQAALAAKADGAACLDGPIAARMIITLPRPKTAARKLRQPTKTPDLSKLARSTEDAITDAGLWADDARVCTYTRLAKVWAGYDDESLPMPGVLVLAAGFENAAGLAPVALRAARGEWATYSPEPDGPTA